MARLRVPPVSASVGCTTRFGWQYWYLSACTAPFDRVLVAMHICLYYQCMHIGHMRSIFVLQYCSIFDCTLSFCTMLVAAATWLGFWRVYSVVRITRFHLFVTRGATTYYKLSTERGVFFSQLSRILSASNLFTHQTIHMLRPAMLFPLWGYGLAVNIPRTKLDIMGESFAPLSYFY